MKALTKIFNLARTYPVIAAFIAVLILVSVWYFGGAFVSGVQSAFTSRQVEKTEGQAKQAEADAHAALSEANKAATDRTVEDRIREQTIEPERVRTAQAVNSSRSRTQKAEASYEQAQKSFDRHRLDRHVLHERNCTDLHALYPGENFAGCQ